MTRGRLVRSPEVRQAMSEAQRLEWTPEMLKALREGRKAEPPVPWEVLAARIGVAKQTAKDEAHRQGWTSTPSRATSYGRAWHASNTPSAEEPR